MGIQRTQEKTLKIPNPSLRLPLDTCECGEIQSDKHKLRSILAMDKECTTVDLAIANEKNHIGSHLQIFSRNIRTNLRNKLSDPQTY